MFLLLTCTVILLLLDSAYIYFYGSAFAKQVTSIQRSPFTVNKMGAVLSYLFIISGLYYFILRRRASIGDAFLLGIFVYGVFDTTNLAIFEKYNADVGFIDTLWGGILFSTTTYLTYVSTGIKNIKY